MTAPPRRRAMLLIGAATALAVAWAVAPLHSPPLYDGVQLPAQPYRYLHPPPGFDRTPPNPAHQSVPVTNAQSPPIAVFTDEQPPQAQLLAAPGAFTVPPGATAFDVTIQAVDPPAQPPPGGAIDGNVYRISVTAAGQKLDLVKGQVASVVLRGPSGKGNAVLDVYNGSSWTRYESKPVGSADTFFANVASLGDAALVTPTVSSSTSSSSGGGGSGGAGLVVVIVAVAVVAAVVLLIVVVRFARRPQPPAPRRRR